MPLSTLIVACALAGAPQEPPQHAALLSVDDRSRIAPVPLDELIAFALYTVQDGVLKLSAQLWPVPEGAATSVALEVERDGAWHELATAAVHPIGWTATFRVTGWDAARAVRYRVRHAGGAVFDGTIRRDPVDRATIVAGALSCNSPGPGGGKIDKHDVVDALRAIDPDVLLFVGDQVYDHTSHTQHWLDFGVLFRDVTRDRLTVCLPDDHDVGQPNLWGQGGRRIDRDTKGGYTRPAGYVQMVERQQTSHLPDPYDPTPVEQGIGVYYTRLNVGGIDFALLEDRKFKSGCFGIVTDALGPRPDHVTNPDYDPASFDVPGKQLLGERQERFLAAWARDWDGAVMKCAVSQTVWSMASTLHSGGKAAYFADFDANGWPQTARNRAVELLRRAGAFHVCGDQHLATITQYGIDTWRDAGIAFCVPAIANLYPRWWAPETPGHDPEPGAQDHTGDFRDGFGNLLTVYAHTNPHATGREPAALHDRMPGFGVVRFDKRARTIAMECWPRMVDPTAPGAAQYPGWPRTIGQFDNLGRHAHKLPDLVFEGVTDPVVEVTDAASGAIVYTVRARGAHFAPRVPRAGTYTIDVRAGDRHARVADVASLDLRAEVPPLRLGLR